MNLEYKHLLNPLFPAQSKVWVYQCSRQFSIDEALQLEDILHTFSAAWKSHGAPVKSEAYLFFGRFIIIMANEDFNAVGGCSTDSLMHFIQKIEQDFNVQLLDRTILAFVVQDKIEVLPMAQLKFAIEKGYITPDTLFFNNAVTSRQQLEDNWLIPVKNSWIQARYIK